MADQIQSGVDDIAQIEARNEVLRRDIARGEAKLLEARAKTVAERVAKQQGKSVGSMSMADAVAGATSPRYQMDVAPEIDYGPVRPPAAQRTIHTDRADELARRRGAIDAADQRRRESPADTGPGFRGGVAEGARDLAKDFTALRVPIAAAVAGFYKISQAATEAAAARQSGAMDVADVRKSLANSLQTLGVGGKEAQGIINQAEAGGFNGLTGDQTSFTKYIGKAAAVKSSSGSPLKADLNGLLRAWKERASGNISEQTLDQFVSTPGALNMPDAALGLAKLGTGGKEAMGGLFAEAQGSARSSDEYRNKARNYSRGQSNANIQMTLDNAERDMGTIGALRKWAFNKFGGQDAIDEQVPVSADQDPRAKAAQQTARAAEETARNTRPPPPSTTAGR